MEEDKLQNNQDALSFLVLAAAASMFSYTDDEFSVKLAKAAQMLQKLVDKSTTCKCYNDCTTIKYKTLIDDLEVIKAQAEWDYPLDWQLSLDKAIKCVKRCEEWDKTVDKCHKVEHDEAVRKNCDRESKKKCKCGKNEFEYDGKKYTTEWTVNGEPFNIDMSKCEIPKEWVLNSPITHCSDPAFKESYINGYTKGMNDCLKNITEVLNKK